MKILASMDIGRIPVYWVKTRVFFVSTPMSLYNWGGGGGGVSARVSNIINE